MCINESLIDPRGSECEMCINSWAANLLAMSKLTVLFKIKGPVTHRSPKTSLSAVQCVVFNINFDTFYRSPDNTR